MLAAARVKMSRYSEANPQPRQDGMKKGRTGRRRWYGKRGGDWRGRGGVEDEMNTLGRSERNGEGCSDGRRQGEEEKRQF